MILEITLTKSPIGRPPRHRRTVKALGLTRLNKSVRLQATPSIRGMINQVSHLLTIRELPEGENS